MEGSTRKGQREGWSVLGRPCEFSVFYTQKHNLQCCHPVSLITIFRPLSVGDGKIPPPKMKATAEKSLLMILGGSTEYRPCQSFLIFFKINQLFCISGRLPEPVPRLPGEFTSTADACKGASQCHPCCRLQRDPGECSMLIFTTVAFLCN